jgi:hypothetical protein
MLSFLANLPDPSNYAAIGWVSVILVSIIMGLNQGMSLLDRVKPKEPQERELVKQPIGVALAEDFVTARDCERLHQGNDDEHRRLHSKVDAGEKDRRREMENLRLEIKKDIADGTAAAEVRVREIHKRINTLAEELPGNVVKLLRDTGALKT